MVRITPTLTQNLGAMDKTNWVKVIVLLLSDGIMCALTAVTWLIQRLVAANYLNWDGAGWVIQNVSD